MRAIFHGVAIAAGMTSAITNPLHGEVMQAVMGSNVVMGHDMNCARWLKKYRQPSEGESAGGRGGREGRRRG